VTCRSACSLQYSARKRRLPSCPLALPGPSQQQVVSMHALTQHQAT